jgi:hypothetical protein
MAASSPYDNAAEMVRTPVTTQAMSIQPGLPSRRDMSADTMKIPDPIMTPMTIMVESKRFRPRTNPWSALPDITDELFM